MAGRFSILATMEPVWSFLIKWTNEHKGLFPNSTRAGQTQLRKQPGRQDHVETAILQIYGPKPKLLKKKEGKTAGKTSFFVLPDYFLFVYIMKVFSPTFRPIQSGDIFFLILPCDSFPPTFCRSFPSELAVAIALWRKEKCFFSGIFILFALYDHESQAFNPSIFFNFSSKTVSVLGVKNSEELDEEKLFRITWKYRKKI